MRTTMTFHSSTMCQHSLCSLCTWSTKLLMLYCTSCFPVSDATGHPCTPVSTPSVFLTLLWQLPIVVFILSSSYSHGYYKWVWQDLEWKKKLVTLTIHKTYNNIRYQHVYITSGKTAQFVPKSWLFCLHRLTRLAQYEPWSDEWLRLSKNWLSQVQSRATGSV